MKLDPRANDLARNVYRDLRDRRLLPVVALLLVAIVAAPLLIRGGDSTPPSSGAPFAEADPFDGAAELRPVVVGDDPGLRNYRVRLDGSPSRNPFKQQFVPKVKSGDSGSGTSTGSGTGLQTQETATTPDTSTTTSEPTDSGSSGNGGGDSSGNGGGGHGPPKNDTVLEASIDVKVGPAGSTKVVEGVKTLTLLPSKGHPIVQYTGSDSAGKRASFAVSGDVVSTEGDGDCKPAPDDCRFLNMRIGQQKKMETTNGKTYVLKLLDVRIERVDVKGASPATLSADLGSTPSG